jgi:hypothetical protein
MGQDEHGPLLDRELEKGPLEFIAIGESSDLVGSDRPIDIEDRNLERPATLPADMILAGADQEPMEPGIEPLGFAQPGQIAPGADECFLDDVFRGIPVAEDASRDRVQAVVCGGRDGIECLVIAPLGALDQVRRHPSDSWDRRGHLPRSTSMASRWRESFIRANDDAISAVETTMTATRVALTAIDRWVPAATTASHPRLAMARKPDSERIYQARRAPQLVATLVRALDGHGGQGIEEVLGQPPLLVRQLDHRAPKPAAR